MNVIVNFEAKPDCAMAYEAGTMIDGVETLLDHEVGALVRRAIRDLGIDRNCKGNVMIGGQCHRLDAPYIFKVKNGAVVDFKRRRGK